MGKDVLVSRALVSALVDGQLRGSEFAEVVAGATGSQDGLATWHAYHVVGDVLRCADLCNGQDDPAFVARLRQHLEAPVGVVAPLDFALRGTAGLAVPVSAAGHGNLRTESANDPDIRWKLLAGAASMAAVAVLGWHLAGWDAGLGQPSQLAVATPPAATAASAAESAVMLRDARLDELLAAHKQFGGTSALQMPAGFLRNATFENPAR